MIIKRIIALVLIVALSANLIACGRDEVKEKAKETMDAVKETASKATETAAAVKDTAVETVDKAGDAIVSAKETVVDWVTNLDFSKFQEGWDYSVDFIGGYYSAAMSGQYVDSVAEQIANLKANINNAAGSARGIAQEAGFAAERWTADTFNIDALARGSKYYAEVLGSSKSGSVDVATSYGENASLKYYKDSLGSAKAQATSIMEAYKEYYSGSNDPMSLQDWVNKNGYEYDLYDLFASIYEGQTRIIPSDQLAEAAEYLQGKADSGSYNDSRTDSYIETLENLKDRLSAPDGTRSKPATYEEMQAIAELSQSGEFLPEDFGISLSSVIPPKFILKQAMGTGLEAALINTVLTVGPDIYSIIKEGAKMGNVDEADLKDAGIESAVAMSEGFVEGSISRIIVTLCKQGVLGKGLQKADANIVAALTVLTIQAVVNGYALSKGEITAEDYGNLIAENLMVSLLSMPTTALMLSFFPGAKVFIAAGCMAGGIIASGGYSVTKDIVMDVVDGGGFEAIIPEGSSDAISIAKDLIASMNIADSLSSLKDTALSTAGTGLITVGSAAGS